MRVTPVHARKLEQFADRFLASQGYRPDGSKRSESSKDSSFAFQRLCISVPTGGHCRGWRLKRKRR